jgi:hypothetical protein
VERISLDLLEPGRFAADVGHAKREHPHNQDKLGDLTFGPLRNGRDFMKLFLLKLTALLALLPACCLAAQGVPEKKMAPAAPQVLDVALGGGGLLQGTVVDSQGAAMKAVPVSVWFDNQQVVSTMSDENGRFSVSGLRGGVHQVVAAQGASVYRLWTAEAAPPSAKPGAVIVPGETVIRGQNGYPMPPFWRSPVLWGVIGYTAGHIVGFNSGIDRTPSSQ